MAGANTTSLGMFWLKPWADKNAVVAFDWTISMLTWLIDVICREYLMAGMKNTSYARQALVLFRKLEFNHLAYVLLFIFSLEISACWLLIGHFITPSSFCGLLDSAEVFLSLGLLYPLQRSSVRVLPETWCMRNHPPEISKKRDSMRTLSIP
jgi:hypothetical protein